MVKIQPIEASRAPAPNTPDSSLGMVKVQPMPKVPRIRNSPLITRAANRVRSAIPGLGPTPVPAAEAPRLVPGSVTWYLRDKRARQALILILRATQERHRQPILSDLRNRNYRNITRYVIYMAFLESVSYPVRPLDLPPVLGDWLQARADIEEGWYPADPCWQCGYRYPCSSPFASSATSRLCVSSAPLAHAPHPWAGRTCAYCGGEIVNHLEWLDPAGKRTLMDFQKAPYREKQRAKAAQWRQELEAVRLDSLDPLHFSHSLDTLARGVAP